MRKQTGFTLIELMIGIALIATVTAIAVPNFIGWLPNYRLRSAVQDLLSNFQKAKLTAVKRNTNTAVCFSTSGYTIFLDPNEDFVKNSVPTPGEEVVVQVTWDAYKSLNVSLASNTFYTVSGQRCLAFQPNGMPVDADPSGFSNITREANLSNTNNKSTNVIVSPAGGIRIEKVTL